MNKTDEMFAYSWYFDAEEIRIYGLNFKNRNICLRIKNFTPYVYLQLPDASGPTVTRVRHLAAKYTIYTEVMNKYHLYNFMNQGRDLSPFLFCQCQTRQSIYDLAWEMKRHGIKVHEIEASPVLQMASLRQLPMAGWISYTPEPALSDEELITSCDEEYLVKWKSLDPSRQESFQPSPKPKCMAFDIEVNSEFTNKMPSDRPDDAIFQISAVIEDEQGERSFLLSLNDKDNRVSTSPLLQDVTVRTYPDEKSLLYGFMELIDTERPNVLTGFNIFGFDIEYILKRCIRFFLTDEIRFIGFNKASPAQIETIKWSSSAFRNQEFKFVNWEGILLLDLLPLVRRDYKLDTYTLKNVSATFLNNTNKDPVTYKDIFTAYQTRSNLDVVGKYCVQDSKLCIELVKYFDSWIALSEMAKVCHVSMFVLYTQGQQIKIYSQIYKFCLRQNIVVNSDVYRAKSHERYIGAYVFDPVPGFYRRVVPLDFASLYPSIIIAKNICYSTIASDDYPDDMCHVFEWEDHVGCPHDPKVIEIEKINKQIEKIDAGIARLVVLRNTAGQRVKGDVKGEKERIQLLINAEREKQRPLRKVRCDLKKSKPLDREDEDGNIVSGLVCASRRYRFIKAEFKKGVVPTIIQNLLDSRASVKRLMKTAGEAELVVFDKQQLAYKVSANSMYGAMGVRVGKLPFMPGAMCVTYVGRESIIKTANLITNKWGGTIVYGDSDSNYVIFPEKKTTQETWDYALQVSEGISKEFPAPMKLEFENCIYERFLILSKKRYMYQSSDRDGTLCKKIGKRGVVLSRRDNSGLLRTIYEEMAMLIFDQATPAIIESHLIEYINSIFRRSIPLSEFVITKSVGDTSGDMIDGRLGDYKTRSLPEDEEKREQLLQGRTEKDYYLSCCPAQVQLAERMRKRGIPVDAGSRIEFVVTRKKGPTLGERIEDYEYFKRRASLISLDLDWYLGTLVNPLDQMLSVTVWPDRKLDFLKEQWLIRGQHQAVVAQLNRLFQTRILVSH